MSIFAELQRSVGKEVEIILRSGAKVSGRIEKAENGVAHLEGGTKVSAGEVAALSPKVEAEVAIQPEAQEN